MPSVQKKRESDRGHYPDTTRKVCGRLGSTERKAEEKPPVKWGRKKKGAAAAVLILMIILGAAAGGALTEYIENQPEIPADVPAETAVSPAGGWFGMVLNNAEYRIVITDDLGIICSTEYARGISLAEADMEYDFLIGPMYGAENGGYLKRTGLNTYDVYFLYVLPYCDFVPGNGIYSQDDLVFEYLEPHRAGQIMLVDEDKMVITNEAGLYLRLSRVQG